MNNNMETDIDEAEWLIDKIKNSESYANDLYGALCNNNFEKNKETWSCTWRWAGGLIADFRENEDYMDYYCSGNEGIITAEIREDLLALGWKIT